MSKYLLTDVAIKQAKATGKPYRMADGGNLYLLVGADGTKSWQFRYRHGGKQQTATLGKLDAVPLAEARKRAQEAGDLVAKGEHLTHEKNINKARKVASSSNTFTAVAADWVSDEARRKKWTPDYKDEVTASLKNHLSRLDSLPVNAVSARICSPILRKADKAAPDMARKVRQRLRSILDFAVEHGLIEINPLPAARGGVKIERQHLPATLDRAGVGAILRAADQTDVGRGVRRAHLLCAFTCQRIGEVVSAQWSEFDLDAGTWAIPRARMKRKDPERGPHLVPLPPGLLALLREWRRVDGEGAVWACPSPRGDSPVTREAVEKFYRVKLDLVGRHGAHGWRSVFSTWAYDAGKDGNAIEAQLDHSVGTKVQAAYDRAQRLDLRRELMAWHEGQLIAARDGAQVIALRKSS